MNVISHVHATCTSEISASAVSRFKLTGSDVIKIQKCVLGAARSHIYQFTSAVIRNYCMQQSVCSSWLSEEDFYARVVFPLVDCRALEISHYQSTMVGLIPVFRLNSGKRVLHSVDLDAARELEREVQAVIDGEIPLYKSFGEQGEFTRAARVVSELPLRIKPGILAHAAEVFQIDRIQYGVPIWQTLNMTRTQADADGRKWIFHSGHDLPLNSFLRSKNTLK